MSSQSHAWLTVVVATRQKFGIQRSKGLCHPHFPMAALCCAVLLIAAHVVAGDASHFRLSFGSCNKHDKPQPFWPFLETRKPDVFAWLGDIIYADTFYVHDSWHVPGSLELAESRIRAQKLRPDYQHFIQSLPHKVIGVWDDHDFGNNNADKTYAIGQHDSDYLWDFLDEPMDSALRNQSGAWSSHVYAMAGRTVRVILLDNRSHLDPYSHPFDADTSPQDMLGEEQWQWLDRELTNVRADVNIIGTGLQVLANDKLPAEGFYMYPGSLARLISLVAKTQTQNAVFISGDVHLAELNSMSCSDLPYTLYDLTSSGLTHAWNALLHKFIITSITAGPRRIGSSYLDLNVGELDIVWPESASSDGQLTMRVFGTDFQVKIEHTLPLHDLGGSNYMPPAHVTECAHAKLSHGLPASCKAVLDGCAGRINILHRIWTHTGALLILTIIFFLLTALFGAPVVVFVYRKRPGSAARVTVAVAVVAVIINILRSF